ncbi:MAG: ATP synthase F0 subunit B [Deltaproteobacteria bacterium]|nr:ATP synthase F0 subunit B [Deltaproteobacteria bacterium]
MREILLLLGFLAAPAVALAASEAGGAAGIPWWEIFKQAVNFSILVGVLVYFLRKPVGAYLKERTEMLRKSIDEAAEARASAAEKLLAIEARMARLSQEIEEMNRKMDAEAEEETRRVREVAQAEIGRLHAQVQFAAEQEVKKARHELRKEAAELSAQAAREIVTKTITPEDQERMVRENIDRIREIVR